MSRDILEITVETIGNKDDTVIFNGYANVSFSIKACIEGRVTTEEMI